MKSKELKALLYAKKQCGDFFDDIDEDCNKTRGAISQADYLAGYNQALEDSKYTEMLEFIKKYYRYLNLKEQEKAKQLIKEATTINE